MGIRTTFERAHQSHRRLITPRYRLALGSFSQNGQDTRNPGANPGLISNRSHPRIRRTRKRAPANAPRILRPHAIAFRHRPWFPYAKAIGRVPILSQILRRTVSLLLTLAHAYTLRKSTIGGCWPKCRPATRGPSWSTKSPVDAIREAASTGLVRIGSKTWRREHPLSTTTVYVTDQTVRSFRCSFATTVSNALSADTKPLIVSIGRSWKGYC